jgi:hypothetical protein
MGALEPKFTDSVEVWTDDYGDFIRNKVQPHVNHYCSRVTGIDQPVLPPEEQKPELWFHIVLRTETSSLTLAIRMDNLYLVGFETTSAVWWEFGKEGDTHLIPGASWLGFGGSYLDLIGKHGKLEDVPLGRAQMSYAVDALAKYPAELILEEELQGGEEDPYDKPKKMLVKLVIMICEGLRFLTVSGTVDEKFESQAARITAQEATDALYWGKISKAVLTNDFSDVKDATGITDREGAKEIVALLKAQKTTEENEDDL